MRTKKCFLVLVLIFALLFSGTSVKGEVLCWYCKSTTTLISTYGYNCLDYICWDPAHYTPNVTECQVWRFETWEVYECNNDHEESLGLVCSQLTFFMDDLWYCHVEVPIGGN